MTRAQLAGHGAGMTPAQLAGHIVAYAADRKAIDIAELDVSEVLGYTDFFVVCSGNTERQVKAIHDAIHLGLKRDHGLLPTRVEGLAQARWVLLDYLDVVVHVFTPETRDFYRLEQLWGEVPSRTIAPQEAEVMVVDDRSSMELEGLEPSTSAMPWQRSPS